MGMCYDIESIGYILCIGGVLGNGMDAERFFDMLV